MPPHWSDLNVILSKEFIIPSNKNIGAKFQQQNGQKSFLSNSLTLLNPIQLTRDALIFVETLLVH
jgi:hypothetical protein